MISRNNENYSNEVYIIQIKKWILSKTVIYLRETLKTIISYENRFKKR